jgi:lipopolysaccharide heptosyltransferase II
VKAKFLVIRFSSIGDIILTSPVVRCLKNQFDGEAEIHFVTKNKFKYLVEHNPNITKVLTIKDKVSEITEELKAENYDFAIDLHNNLRSGQVKRRADGVSLSFQKLNLEKWLLVNLKVNKLPNEHIVNRYLKPLKYFDVAYDEKGLDYFLPSDFSFEKAYELGLPKTKPYVVFAIGGSFLTKRLPTHKIIEICQKLSHKVVLIGGPEDAETAKEIETKTGSNCVSLCGKISVHQSAWIIKNALGVISHDTGMMHIAAAFNKPLASVWGNTIPEFGMYPLMPLVDASPTEIFEVKNLGCRPCSKLGFEKCPKKHFKCMEEINSNQVAEFANSWLQL